MPAELTLLESICSAANRQLTDAALPAASLIFLFFLLAI